MINCPKNNPNKRLLRSFAIENEIKQIVDEPTRITEHSRTLIDLIFVSDNHRIVQSGVIHASLSDNSVTFCVMKGGVPKLPPRKFEYHSFKNYNKDPFVKDMLKDYLYIAINTCIFTFLLIFIYFIKCYFARIYRALLNIIFMT